MSYQALTVHFGFATKRRVRCLAAAFDEPMEKAVEQALTWNSARLLAFGAATEHVHVLASHSARKSAERLVAESKRGLSELFDDLGVEVKWQDGFWAVSVSPGAVAQVARYIDRQRSHHAAGLDFETELRAFAAVEERARRKKAG